MIQLLKFRAFKLYSARIPTDPNAMEFRRMGDAFMRLVLIFGKIVTLSIVISVLKYVVCFFFP